MSRYCLRRCNELFMQKATRGAIMKGSILTFGIVGALALALSSTTSFAQAINGGNFNFSGNNNLVMLVRGSHAGGGGGWGGGGRGGWGWGRRRSWRWYGRQLR